MANAANRARRRPAPKAPTKNQLDYIKDLVERKGAEGAVLHRQALANGNLTASSASLLIRALRDLPDVNKIPYRGPRKGKPASGSNDHVPLGIHRGVTLDPEVFIIVQVRESANGHRYGKVLDPESKTWNYVKGALAGLGEGTLLTQEQAKEFGINYGVCAICGKTLTTEESVSYGIGPVCRRRFASTGRQIEPDSSEEPAEDDADDEVEVAVYERAEIDALNIKELRQLAATEGIIPTLGKSKRQLTDALLGIDDDLAFDQETGEVLTDHVGEPEAFPEDPPPPPTARKRGRTAIKEGGLLAQRFGN